MRPKTKRLLLGSVCAGFVGLLATGAMHTRADAITNYAFPAVTDENAAVGSAEHPLRILEIVPNESMGMIGYMIDGCEPISMEALSGQEYGATQTYRDNMVTSGLVQEEKVVSYAFASELPSGAEMAGWSGEFGKWWKYTNSATDDTTGYSELGFYENVGAGNGTYSYDEAGDSFSYVGIGAGAYSWNLAECYVGVGGGNGSYTRMINGTDLNTCTFAYVGDGAGSYACTVLLDTTAEDTTIKDPNTRYWTYRTQSEYYSRWCYQYTNNDCFLQAVFDATVKDGFCAEVVTITPDMLKAENLQLIDQADLIVMTAQEYMTEVWDAYNVDGITRTAEEKAARPTTFLGANGNDLTWEATLRIVERMASATPPGMYLEQPALYGGGNSGEYNVGKLYIMLMQYGANVFWNTSVEGNDNFVADTYVTSDGKTTYGGVYTKRNDVTGQDERFTNWNQQTFLTPYGESIMHEAAFPLGRTGEVFGTILLYNGDTSFLRGFLTTVVSEITSTNPDYPMGSNSEMFDYYEQQTGVRPTEISMGNAAKYIIGNALETENADVARKEKLHILELQPCSKFIYGSDYWQLYYMSIFPWFSGNLTEDVTITTMTTYQFIGDITDLNSEYDLIIIGSSQDATNGLNGYNDSQMGNLIYTSIGDLVTNYRDRGWSWSSGGVTANAGMYEQRGSDAYQMSSRYSGTDITKKKYEELRDFMAAGNPIVVDAKLYSQGTQVDTNLADVNSHIYQLASGAYQVGNGCLVFKAGASRTFLEQKCLKEALLQESLSLIFAEDGTGLPAEYSAVTENRNVPVKDANGNTKSWTNVDGIIVSEHYNTDTDENGNPILRYTFALKGNAQSVYGVKLYLDHNGDGIFNDSGKERAELSAAGKEMSNLNATLTSEEANGSRISIYDQTSQMYIFDGNLVAGHTYQLIYRVRSTERGILPWKLEVYDRGNFSIRSSKTGYTAFRVSGSNTEKEQINVLQMNLMPNMQDETTTFVNFADETTVTGAKFAAYLEAVEDYNVNIEFMRNRAWYAEFGEFGSKARSMGYTKEIQIARFKEFLEDYDMLVIGYCDMTAFTNDEIFYEGFMEFVNQGKSVILSHDLVSDASFLYMHNNLTTKYDPSIRTLAGQRRKYYVGDTNYYRYSSTMLNGAELSLLPPDDFLIWYGRYGSAWNQLGKEDFMSVTETNIPEAPSDYANEFMDNSVRLMMTYSRNMKRDRILNGNITNFSWLGHTETQYVEIANKGQITTYPYRLGDVMQVSTTHVQNYQLDLEQEDGGDVTVWYNLTDSYDSDVRAGGTNDGVYSSRSGDSRNNYYIYTKGNITYTGLGHRNATLTNDEVKLFVNTMISSYRDVPEVPYARVENADASEHKGNYTLYVPLTGAESEENTIEIAFSIVDENDHNITSIRNYRVQYTDANGNVISDTIVTSTPNGSLLQYLADEKQYQVQQNGTYTFQVPCEKVLNEGEAVYYLNVSSSYYAGTKEYTTSKVTKVVVYAMPLFSLH